MMVGKNLWNIIQSAFGTFYSSNMDLSHRKDKIIGDKGDTSSVEIVDSLETEQEPESSAKSSELLHRAKRRKIASGKIKLLRCYETRRRTNKLHDNGAAIKCKEFEHIGQ